MYLLTFFITFQCNLNVTALKGSGLVVVITEYTWQLAQIGCTVCKKG